MPPDNDPMDVPAVIDGLNRSLSLQYRSALQFTAVSGSLVGLEWTVLGTQLWEFAAAELEDARRLVEKITALGGQATDDVGTFRHEGDATAAVEHLLENEGEALAALHAVIADTGQEPRSEALEHLLEHLILRKQSQADTLHRALGTKA